MFFYALQTDMPEPGLDRQPWHDLQMKTNKPVYTKQPRIPEAHREAVKCKLMAWLKQGLIQPDRSKFNNPFYTITGREGTV
jgi:hypothetical protein